MTRAALVVGCLCGTLAFSALFAMTFVARPQIETAAGVFLRAEVERQARERYGARLEHALDASEHAAAIATRLGKDAKALHAFSASRAPDAIGALLAELCHYDCEEKKQAKAREHAASIRDRIAESIVAAKTQIAGLRDFVQGAYRQRLYALISEARVFTGLNAGLFALMLAMLWFKRRDMRLVLLPVAMLLVSTAGAAYLYFATQNWLWTILLSDYIGFWYLGIVALTLTFVIDISVFHARLTLNILGILPQALVPTC